MSKTPKLIEEQHSVSNCQKYNTPIEIKTTSTKRIKRFSYFVINPYIGR